MHRVELQLPDELMYVILNIFHSFLFKILAFVNFPNCSQNSLHKMSFHLQKNGLEDLATYNELLDFIAVKCEGVSGASLAGVARAAASRALERAVCDFAGSSDGEGSDSSSADGSSIADCLVTKMDFELAIEDVLESSGNGDGGEDEEEPSPDDGLNDNNKSS